LIASRYGPFFKKCLKKKKRWDEGEDEFLVSIPFILLGEFEATGQLGNHF